MSSGSVPPNPPLVLIDTDVLVQFLVANEIAPLRDLKRKYQVQPAIVDAVEYEVRSPGKSLRKYSSLIEPRLQKALGNGTILLIDGRSLPSIVGVGASAVETQIAITGTKYHKFVDYGEAYSHAAAAVLGAPLFTHDRNAIRVLNRAGEQICKYVLRAFDLYTFAYHIKLLDVRSCDKVRQSLAALGEWLPDAFFKRSFENGLPFSSRGYRIKICRLLDRQRRSKSATTFNSCLCHRLWSDFSEHCIHQLGT